MDKLWNLSKLKIKYSLSKNGIKIKIWKEIWLKMSNLFLKKTKGAIIKKVKVGFMYLFWEVIEEIVLQGKSIIIIDINTKKLINLKLKKLVKSLNKVVSLLFVRKGETNYNYIMLHKIRKMEERQWKKLLI